MKCSLFLARCFRRLPPLAAVIAFLAAGTVSAVEEPGDHPELTPNVQAEDGMHWSDEAVSQVSDYLGYTVNWFDDFFDDERYLDETQAKIHLRWRNDVSYEQGEEDVDFKTRVSARVDLPQFNHKVKLMLFSDDEQVFGDSDTNNVLIEEREDNSGIGVRYDMLDDWIEHLSVSGNMRLDPLEIVFKLRHRHQWDITPDLFGRLTTTGLFNTREGFGLRVKSDLEKDLDEGKLLRWTNSAEWEEEYVDEGVNWSSVLTHYRMLSPKEAVAYYAGLNGHTRPDSEVDRYLIGTRYRRNVFRPWLFVEVIPEFYWPQDERKEVCETCLALTARVEVVFRKWD